MRKKISSNNDKTGLCPLFREDCKKDECMWFHKQFDKCNLEIVGYNLFKMSKSIDELIVEMKNQ